MFRMYASISHSYTHLILALGIVREPTVWGFITSKYPGIHDIGLPNIARSPGPTGLYEEVKNVGLTGKHLDPRFFECIIVQIMIVTVPLNLAFRDELGTYVRARRSSLVPRPSSLVPLTQCSFQPLLAK